MTKEKYPISSLGTVGTFIKVGSCSETLMNVLNRSYGHPMKLEENGSMPFAGGILQHGYQCGMIWGATLAAGARAFELYGDDPKSETAAIIAAQNVVESFRNHKGNINCMEITELDKSSTNWDQLKFFLLKGGTIGCFKMSAQFAPIAFDTINEVFSNQMSDAPGEPVSCSAMLAKKMGATPQQVVIAAGLAGGIGLCGGVCGALGAAIWIHAMQTIQKQDGKVDYKDPRLQEIIDHFMEIADYKFECSEIVGRKFESIEDHAQFIQEGGCQKIIEELAERFVS